jgi:hypothetical protein
VQQTRRSTHRAAAPAPSPRPPTAARSPARRVGGGGGGGAAGGGNVTSNVTSTAAAAVEASRRKLYVLVSLVTVMSLTGGLLLLVRPDPAAPDTSFSLMAADSTDRAFNTKVPVRPGRWKYVFVHHSNTPGGSASSLADAGDSADGGGLGPADHFVIGNGDGAADGEIQIGPRWNRQEAAGRTPGVDRMDPACVSICLIGDFDRTAPTPTQVRRLGQLVEALQGRLRIGPDRVWMADAANSPAGTGRHFPRTAFRQQLVP